MKTVLAAILSLFALALPANACPPLQFSYQQGYQQCAPQQFQYQQTMPYAEDCGALNYGAVQRQRVVYRQSFGYGGALAVRSYQQPAVFRQRFVAPVVVRQRFGFGAAAAIVPAPQVIVEQRRGLFGLGGRQRVIVNP